MKKISLIIAIAFLAIQSYGQEELSFGPRAGLNFAKVSNVDDAKLKPGMLLGATLVYSFQTHFGITTDLLYSMEGVKFSNTFTNGNVVTQNKFTTSLNYLRLPIQGTYFFNEMGDDFRPKITLGPSFGILVGAKNKAEHIVTSPESSTTETETIKGTDDFTTADIGATIGTGFNLKVGNELWLNTDLRYYIGATDITKTNVYGINDTKNRNLNLSLALAWGIGNY